MHNRDIETADLVGRRHVDETDDRSGGNEQDGNDVRVTGEGDRPVWSDARELPNDDSDLLFADADRSSFDQRWNDVQGRFVDDPKGAVASADSLVAEVMQGLASRFADHKSSLEQQWAGGGEADTEELRQAMHRYRAFFRRLLAA
jgi:hypothetical protein